MPAAIGRLIAELGLRYRPTAATDLLAHAEALRLLATDVADLPADRLERAINAWVRTERWMPRASNLVAFAQRDQRNEQSTQAIDYRTKVEQAQAFCDSRNPVARNKDYKPCDHIEWFVNGNGEPQLRFIPTEPPPAIGRVDPADVDRLNRALRKYGAPFRYDRRGYDFDLPAGANDPTDPATAAPHP